MIKCNTFIIQNKESLLNSLNIGGVELLINEDGTLKTKDKDGNVTNIGNNGNAFGKIKHLEVGINNTKQTIFNGNEYQIFFDEDFVINDDEDFSNEVQNSIKILTAGHYFISFNISLDMYNGNRSTVSGYIKTDIDDSIVEKSVSYSYFNSKSQGFNSINNSFIYDAIKGEKISLHIKRKEGSGVFYTVPESTNFNIFRID